jgi:hypothetical protein
MTVIDWHAEVKEYKENYDDDNRIHEYIDGLIPIYFGEIYTTYHDVIGTPLNIKIESHHTGLEVGQIMQGLIFDEYMEQFMNAWNEAEEEE